MLREEEGEKYLEEAHRLSIYPRLVPSNGIRGSDESHFFNRLSCFVSRVFLSFATQSCTKAFTSPKARQVYVGVLLWRVYQLRARPSRRFMDSKPACPLPTSSASLLPHRHSAKLSSRSTFFGIAKTRTELDLLSLLRSHESLGFFLSTYRVLRDKNIKQNRNRCSRCTVTVYPDRPWQAPGHLSTAQLPDLNNVRFS